MVTAATNTYSTERRAQCEMLASSDGYREYEFLYTNYRIHNGRNSHKFYIWVLALWLLAPIAKKHFYCLF